MTTESLLVARDSLFVAGMESRTHSRFRLRPPACRLRPSASYSAFTLIEMLVSLAITLIMMGAVVSLFGLISDNVSGSRSIIELSERLRSARNRLQSDLQGATATMRPPLRPENDEGYFEIVEGPDSDMFIDGTSNVRTYSGDSWNLPWGDADDVLMFTVRSRDEPFVGKYNFNQTAESQVAEVMYFCVENGQTINAIAQDDGGTALPQKLYTLYRRALIVLPGFPTPPPLNPNYFDNHDFSMHVAEQPVGTFIGVLNSLGDLTKRENRFAHHNGAAAYPPAFPYEISSVEPTWPGPLLPTSNNRLAALDGLRFGDDVLLTNVLAFDVQVYDPTAPLRNPTGSTEVVAPSDPGYTGGTNITVGTETATGAYVDLGTSRYTGGLFDNALFLPRRPGGVLYLQPVTDVIGTRASATYDTWSLHYEGNGVDEDGDGTADQGRDGFDTDAANGVDDPGERETQAPFAAPLRGIRITIRVYEPGSQQVRQMTVVQDFLPD